MRDSNKSRAVEPASSLRQRAARARDAAGRFIRRSAPAASEPDPALEAVAEFRAAWDTLGHAMDAAGTAEVASEIVDAEGDAYERLKTVRPTTPAGFHALAEAWAVVLEGERGGEPGVTHADHAADSLIAGAGACVPVGLPAGSDDNVLALIEEHRTFFAEWDRLSGVWNGMVPDDPGYAEAMAASDLPGRREVTAYEALFSAQPETLAGAAALASYLGEAVRRTRIDAQPSDGERALGTIARALRALAPVSASRSHPDAALLALGAEFVAAWAVEDAVDDNEAEYHACTGLAEQIARLPSVTVGGLGIKALVLAQLDSEDSGPRQPISAQGPLASHWNVLRQIQEGAARLAAGRAASASSSASVKPDLSALTVVELARLYPVLVRAEVALGSAGESPCFLQNNRTERTNAGRIINWEVDRLQRFSSAVAAEISRRQPNDRGDQAERANTLLTHMVLTGGVEEHPELISEICATWGFAR